MLVVAWPAKFNGLSAGLRTFELKATGENPLSFTVIEMLPSDAVPVQLILTCVSLKNVIDPQVKFVPLPIDMVKSLNAMLLLNPTPLITNVGFTAPAVRVEFVLMIGLPTVTLILK